MLQVPNDWNCDLFVQSGLDREALAHWLATRLSGSVTRRQVSAKGLCVWVHHNAYWPPEPGESADLIATAPLYLEVSPRGDDFSAYLEDLSALMRLLAAEGLAVEAVCEFDELLPGRGSLIQAA